MKDTTALILFGCCFLVLIPFFSVIEIAVKGHYNTKVQTAILECKTQALKTGNSSQFIEKICAPLINLKNK